MIPFPVLTLPMTDSRYWGAPMTDSALPNEHRGGRYREIIIGGGSIGKTSPDDGFPILTPPDRGVIENNVSTDVLLLLVIPEVDVINFGARQFGETG